MDKNKNKQKQLHEDIRKLVKERIKATSQDFEISIGSDKYNQKEILEHVNEGDEIGQQIINTQMQYLRDLARGAIYEDEEDFTYTT